MMLIGRCETKTLYFPKIGLKSEATISFDNGQAKIQVSINPINYECLQV